MNIQPELASSAPLAAQRSPVRRPVVGLALACLAGTWAGINLAADPCVLLACSSILLLIAAAVSFLARNRSAVTGFASSVCIHASVLLLFWLNAGTRVPRDIHRLDSSVITGEARTNLTGVVDDEPFLAYSSPGRNGWRFPFRADAGGNFSETVRVTFFAPSTARPPQYGERWSMTGRLSEDASSKAGWAYQQKRLYFTASRYSAELLSTGHGSGLLERCLKARARAKDILSVGIDDYSQIVAIQNSLLLGYRSQMPDEIYQAFARTGTLHIFAISGSHVVVLAAIIVFVLSTFGVSRAYWVISLAPLLIFYTIMTGLQPSAVRACVMAVIFWLAPLLHRKPDIYASMALSAILILAVVPVYLQEIGFILSYIAVLGLVVFYPIFVNPLLRCFAPDTLRLQPEAVWVQRLRWLWRQFSILLGASSAAWLVTAPLTAYYFAMFSPIGLIGNLIVIPLASLIIVTGSLSLVLGSCVQILADIFNHANLCLVALMSSVTKFLASVPGGNFPVTPPPMWLILAFYACLAVLAFRLRGNGGKKPFLDDMPQTP